MSYYRIGNFAQMMGVTPDFLKYYEAEGILQPSKVKGSYRYYHFSKGRILQQCRGNRNLGFSIKELKQLSDGCSLEEYCEMIRHQKERLQNEAARSSELLSWIRDFESIQPYFQGTQQWYIMLQPDYYYLPQARMREMIDAEDYCERIRKWSEWLPCINCTQRIPLSSGEPFSLNTEPYFEWGYQADCEFAERVGLDVNDPVKKYPGGRYFVYPYITPMMEEGQPDGEYDRNVLIEPFALLKKFNLECKREILRRRIFSGEKDGKKMDYYIIYIGL